MKEKIDEYELSLPVNVWSKILYNNINEIKLDIYYNDKGHPSNIHCFYGAKAINEYRLLLINEICIKNNTNDIWRVSSDAFAILHKGSNCDAFKIKYRDQEMNILKKTIIINVISLKN